MSKEYMGLFLVEYSQLCICYLNSKEHSCLEFCLWTKQSSQWRESELVYAFLPVRQCSTHTTNVEFGS